MVLTIGLLLSKLSTLHQYELLRRADLMFPAIDSRSVEVDHSTCTCLKWRGRYYGRPLSAEQADKLIEGLR